MLEPLGGDLHLEPLIVGLQVAEQVGPVEPTQLMRQERRDFRATDGLRSLFARHARVHEREQPAVAVRMSSGSGEGSGLLRDAVCNRAARGSRVLLQRRRALVVDVQFGASRSSSPWILPQASVRRMNAWSADGVQPANYRILLGRRAAAGHCIAVSTGTSVH